jgi:transposase-like protein
MTTQELLRQIRDIGYPIAILAKKVDKAPSTVQKWVTGASKYMSIDTEQALREEIKKLKEFWVNLDI